MEESTLVKADSPVLDSAVRTRTPNEVKANFWIPLKKADSNNLNEPYS